MLEFHLARRMLAALLAFQSIANLKRAVISAGNLFLSRHRQIFIMPCEMNYRY